MEVSVSPGAILHLLCPANLNTQLALNATGGQMLTLMKWVSEVPRGPLFKPLHVYLLHPRYTHPHLSAPY